MTWLDKLKNWYPLSAFEEEILAVIEAANDHKECGADRTGSLSATIATLKAKIDGEGQPQ